MTKNKFFNKVIIFAAIFALFVYFVLFNLKQNIDLFYDDFTKLEENKLINIGGLVTLIDNKISYNKLNFKIKTQSQETSNNTSLNKDHKKNLTNCLNYFLNEEKIEKVIKKTKYYKQFYALKGHFYEEVLLNNDNFLVNLSFLSQNQGQYKLFYISDRQSNILYVLHLGKKQTLFRSNQGIILKGLFLKQFNIFISFEMLIKHDEGYKSLKNK